MRTVPSPGCYRSPRISQSARIWRSSCASRKRWRVSALLAGGVAHDFNNILAIIQMQADFLKDDGGLSAGQMRVRRRYRFRCSARECPDPPTAVISAAAKSSSRAIWI